MSHKGQIVLVKWEDTRGVTQEWTDFRLLAKADPCICYSVGLVLKENKRRIVVVPHWGNDPCSGCGEMAIPASAVRDIKVLRK